MIVAVGSENPVKIAAAKAVVGRIWLLVEVHSMPVSNSVSAMPMDDDECIAGAHGRAKEALTALDADLGLGLEGGVQLYRNQLFLTGWAAAIDRAGRMGIGSAARLLLPPVIQAAVLDGHELGPIMDEQTGRRNTNHAEGAIGILTGGLMTRQRSFEAAIAYALAPWMQPQWYPLE